MMGLLDLEKHFAFYGAYHSNPINIVIHICLDKKSGFIAGLMCFACWVGSSVFADRLGPSLAVKKLVMCRYKVLELVMKKLLNQTDTAEFVVCICRDSRRHPPVLGNSVFLATHIVHVQQYET
ncbi:hypothetical protein DY000_02018255 [Brassica cretica]|uniref:Uncharacterized protein n=1 Tax=Brassica cretica TaxID=69181 RepID=A0ABQ7CPY8_BRACR|nr:hypothetical protein DY000_02018255 [Brassica cretica]